MESEIISLINHPLAIWTIVVFTISYLFVIFEERFLLRKSKPVMIAASVIWAMVAIIVGDDANGKEQLHHAAQETIAEYGALLLFLLSAMTYIAALSERDVFNALRSKLIAARFSYRKLLWVTGGITFILSPIADNMTAAMVMGSIALTLCAHNRYLIPLFMVNIVNAANAGGVWSPFGDITTLMVWQAGKMTFTDFFVLFIPAVICFVMPSIIFTFLLPKEIPNAENTTVEIKTGGKVIIALGILTIILAITFEQILHIPSCLGMILGLGLLLTFGHILNRSPRNKSGNYDVFALLHHTEWDTLLFFFGVIFSISGIAFLGYLHGASEFFYGQIGADITNIGLGVFSALVDNIPLMFAILKMNPEMNQFQWELITLTLGIGGSMLSIGSAAGVALMGIAKTRYGFMSHLKYTPILILGYIGAILGHYLLN